MTKNQFRSTADKHTQRGKILLAVALIIIVLAGAYLRLVGVNWDENQHMHPDERFLSLVQVAISPVENLSEYFDTADSSLNPANRGYTFFVYGTLPIFIIRYIGDALGQIDYHAITLVGRYVSALFDLTTVLLVFAVGKRLYGRWVGLLGGLFYALAVLPIQLSHYMTVDTITNTFAFLAVYAAVWALTRQPKADVVAIEPLFNGAEADNESDNPERTQQNFDFAKVKQVFCDLAPYILFGVALGAATASKINAVVLAIILPLVEGIRYFRMEEKDRRAALGPIIFKVVLAAVLSFLVFRLGQPYAFNGPGFFNFGINESWWASLQSLRSQASGNVDFPPALQWARRPITFSWKNLVAWGLGWPLGLFSWLAFIGMGWQIVRKRGWQRHLPLWVFTGLYFAWQSISWVRTMRYQVLIYPMLALFAGWGLVQLCLVKKPISLKYFQINPKVIRVAGILLAAGIILSTAVWAFSFSRIYSRPHTRVAASRWIYQNIPGALNLQMQTADGVFTQPLPYRAGDTLTAESPYSLPFSPIAGGYLSTITFPYVLDQEQRAVVSVLHLTVTSAESPDQILASAQVESTFLPAEQDWRGSSYEFLLDNPLSVVKGELYYLHLVLVEGETTLQLNGSPRLSLVTHDDIGLDQPLARILQGVRADSPYSMNVQIVQTGLITEVDLPYLVDQSGKEGVKELKIDLQITSPEGVSSYATLRSDFLPGEDVRGKSAKFVLAEPLLAETGQTLLVTLTTSDEGVRLVPHGSVPAHESSWDDAVPYPVDGFSPYSETGGIYRGDLNFEMYWMDDALKLGKFETNLDSADYIFITSNRQWGTTTRVPERYPLTTYYYRHLLGCPEEAEVEWCYSVAEPDMFTGALGFELVEVFHSNPNLGPLEFNTQFAEEAFTVYDHPKVLIFSKTADYDPVEVRMKLRSVDLDKVVYFTPGDAANYSEPTHDEFYEPRYSLNLPEKQLEIQREGGTWSELFNRESLLNQSQPVAVVVFYLFVTLLGFLCYPLVRLALPGLSDRGYPLSKLGGLLLLSFFVWILGSFGVAFTPITIILVLIGIVILSVGLTFLQRKTIIEEIKHSWRYFLIIEVLALVAFVFFMVVRLGNPDLWHPFKGGEKPMDFSYLNAVLKSTIFPPFDPWFSGGYINYYYYGFVIVGVPIKLLGIIPAVAYNIVLPLWYSILILGAFSVGWNLYNGIPRSRALRVGETKQKRILNTAFWAGLATAIGLAVLGNLGTLRLITSGFQRIATGGAVVDEATLGQQIRWVFQGFLQFIQGTPMPFYPGDWYWVPSRVIPGEAITEFPFFTFIYADLHAHLIAFPITVFAISWSLSVILNKARWGEKDGHNKWIGIIAGFMLGGLVIGALRPTNTWDFYTYLVLASASLMYSILRHYQPKLKMKFQGVVWLEKIGAALAAILTLTLLAVLFYQPFAYWFGQGYAQIDIWEGSRTPLNSYFVHWGLFLFIIICWMGWETYHWMKTTPQSDLKRLEPYMTLIFTLLILFAIVLFILLIMGVTVALIAVPLGVWTLVLMFRPGQSDGQRFLLFLIGTALTLTLAVELIYLPGDIGRMNSVFKFYLQAWILFALSAGVCIVWTIKSLPYWNKKLLFFWQAVLYFLVTSALLFTVMGTTDKIRDRMAKDAPRSLDGMAYMTQATYYDMGVDMQLIEDYDAIRWMQDTISGSPVIVEGQAYEYRWGNRYTINTGLPGVVGWNWHQRQQRAVLRSNSVQERVDAINAFYETEDLNVAAEFLNQFDVAYIVLGQLERSFYPGPGLEKFQQFEGHLWQAVYQDGSTIIYEVIK